jgi:hypothetical protein
MTTQWHGTNQEAFDLRQAIVRHCACQLGLLGAPLSGCAAHRLLEEQRTLDGLLYGRRIANRLRHEEWR